MLLATPVLPGHDGYVSTNQVSALFAVLALGALAMGVLGIIGAVAPRADAHRGQLRPALLPLALAIAAVSTAGSLYYSEIAGYAPCEMCWYQRICMYALVPVLAVAVARRDRQGGWYGLPLAVGGLGLSVYHYQLQLFPSQGSSCDVQAPCTYQWVDVFGFVSVPFMAGCGFVGVAGLAALSLRSVGAGEHAGRVGDPVDGESTSEAQ